MTTISFLFLQLSLSVVTLSICSTLLRSASAQGQQGGNPLAGLGLPIPNLGQLFGGGLGGPGGLGGLNIPGNQRAGGYGGAQQVAQQQPVPPLLSRLRGGTYLCPLILFCHINLNPLLSFVVISALTA